MFGVVIMSEHTVTAIIGVICVFLSILAIIYAIRSAIHKDTNFKVLAFSSAILGSIAFFILLLISGA